MTRRGWLRLVAAGVLVVWLCLFLHWDNTEKSIARRKPFARPRLANSA